MGASEVFSKIEQDIKSLNFIISSKDLNRPWGGFLVINETQAHEEFDLLILLNFDLKSTF